MPGDELGLDDKRDPSPEKPPVGPNCSGSYQETQAVYAARYRYHVRAIKGWVAEGRAAGELPPLDLPGEMPGWWTRVHPGRNVPARILAAAESASSSPPAATTITAPAPAPKAPAEVGAPESAESSSAPDEPLALGYAASLQRLRNAEAEAYVAYEKAKSEKDKETGLPNPSRVEQARRAWTALSEELRNQEDKAVKVLSASGEVLLKADVRRRLVEMHSAIVGGVRSLLRRVRAKVGNVTLDDAAVPYDAEIDRLFSELNASEFAPLPPANG